MSSSQELQPHPVTLEAFHASGNVQCFLLPYYSSKRLITDGLYFDVIVFFLEQGVNENGGDKGLDGDKRN